MYQREIEYVAEVRAINVFNLRKLGQKCFEAFDTHKLLDNILKLVHSKRFTTVFLISTNYF